MVDPSAGLKGQFLALAGHEDDHVRPEGVPRGSLEQLRFLQHIKPPEMAGELKQFAVIEHQPVKKLLGANAVRILVVGQHHAERRVVLQAKLTCYRRIACVSHDDSFARRLPRENRLRV